LKRLLISVAALPFLIWSGGVATVRAAETARPHGNVIGIMHAAVPVRPDLLIQPIGCTSTATAGAMTVETFFGHDKLTALYLKTFVSQIPIHFAGKSGASVSLPTGFYFNVLVTHGKCWAHTSFTVVSGVQRAITLFMKSPRRRTCPPCPPGLVPAIDEGPYPYFLSASVVGELPADNLSVEVVDDEGHSRTGIVQHRFFWIDDIPLRPYSLYVEGSNFNLMARVTPNKDGQVIRCFFSLPAARWFHTDPMEFDDAGHCSPI
jgi:hypothetical protein